MGHLGRAAKLAILAITGQGVAYLFSIVLARRLGVEGFEAYVVASAALPPGWGRMWRGSRMSPSGTTRTFSALWN